MKEQGYHLVGAEQTANSKCLTEYSFPKKTVLLLGYVFLLLYTRQLTMTIVMLLPILIRLHLLHIVFRNEREGIPVELIQLLDVCVEIPQQGLIRSLNVHVSGALLIWEYTRQQLSSKQ